MKVRSVFLVLMAAVSVLLVGCTNQEPTPAVAEGMPPGDVAGPGGRLRGTTPDEASGSPDEASGSPDKVSGLALGTLRLEGTENAVTPAQASELLPLWTIVQGGSLQGQAETDAVLKQIEAKLTESQRAAVDAMGLTFQDVGTWMQEQGVEMPTRPAEQGAPGQGGPGAFQNTSEEERTRLREEFQGLTQEQRATRMASLPSEARGIQRPEGGGQRGAPGAPGGFGGRAGGSNFLLGPLIELLTKRAAE